jgi:predicted nucleic acid-binding protein
MLLECCLAAKAKMLVSRDKDLIDINVLPFDLKILTPQKFIEE